MSGKGTAAWGLEPILGGGERFSALVARTGEAAGTDVISDAVSSLHGRIVGAFAPAQAMEAGERHAGIPVLIVDVSDSGEERLPDGVRPLLQTAIARQWPTIVAVNTAQIDDAFGEVDPEWGQLLCQPAFTDWVSALAATTSIFAETEFADRTRESEAARLARLNQEVARIAEVLARLTEREQPPAAMRTEDRTTGFAPGPVGFDLSAATVRETIRARRLRDRFFDARLFEDPAWDMMLDLLAAHLERGQVSVSSLCIASGVAPTTALRWISKLTENGLLVREADPFDKRRAFMALSPQALEALGRYMAALQEQRLPLP